MRTLHGLARDAAATIQAGALIAAEPIALEVTATGDPITPGDGRSSVTLRFDPATHVGEVRTCPRGRWSDRVRFEVRPGTSAEPTEDEHVATLAALRGDLCEFAASEFGDEREMPPC